MRLEFPTDDEFEKAAFWKQFAYFYNQRVPAEMLGRLWCPYSTVVLGAAGGEELKRAWELVPKFEKHWLRRTETSVADQLCRLIFYKDIPKWDTEKIERFFNDQRGGASVTRACVINAPEHLYNTPLP